MSDEEVLRQAQNLSKNNQSPSTSPLQKSVGVSPGSGILKPQSMMRYRLEIVDLSDPNKDFSILSMQCVEATIDCGAAGLGSSIQVCFEQPEGNNREFMNLLSITSPIDITVHNVDDNYKVTSSVTCEQCVKDSQNFKFDYSIAEPVIHVCTWTFSGLKIS